MDELDLSYCSFLYHLGISRVGIRLCNLLVKISAVVLVIKYDLSSNLLLLISRDNLSNCNSS